MARIEARNRKVDSVGVGMYLLAAFLFAFNGSVSKLAMNAGLDPGHLTQIRSSGAMVFLVIFVLFTNRGAFRIKQGELLFLLVYGVIAFVLVQFLYFYTVSLLPLGLGTLLIFLAPVVVGLWVRFGKKQPVSNRLWAAIALSLAGLALVAQIWQGFSFNLLGVFAGLLCAVILALYWLLGEAGQKKRDGVSLTMWGFIFASITWAILQPWWNFPFSILREMSEPLTSTFPSLPIWGIVLWGVLLGTIAPFLLVLGSLRRIGAQRAGIVATTEPLWAGLIAIVVLGETLNWIQALGASIVVVGVVLAETSRRMSPTEDSDSLPTPV
jgi:drug/metabolite transporter (DMT)-like permease